VFSLGVLWSTTDPVHFAEKGVDPGALYLWDGANPGYISPEDAKTAAAQFPDIEITFRETLFTRSVGPQLLNASTPRTVDLSNPFTCAPSVQIALRNIPAAKAKGSSSWPPETSSSHKGYTTTSSLST